MYFICFNLSFFFLSFIFLHFLSFLLHSLFPPFFFLLSLSLSLTHSRQPLCLHFYPFAFLIATHFLLFRFHFPLKNWMANVAISFFCFLSAFQILNKTSLWSKQSNHKRNSFFVRIDSPVSYFLFIFVCPLNSAANCYSCFIHWHAGSVFF